MPQWIIYALFSAIFAALVAIFGKIGVSSVDSTLATTVRVIIMALFLTLTSLVVGKWELFNSIHSKAWLFIILSGVAGALSWLFYFYALQKGPASGVAALDRLSVVFVLIFAALFLAEKLTWLKVFGIIILTIGAVLVAI
ncbi:MAG: EamA family transporter [Candidatus Buchananbacteria bacterium]